MCISVQMVFRLPHSSSIMVLSILAWHKPSKECSQLLLPSETQSLRGKLLLSLPPLLHSLSFSFILQLFNFLCSFFCFPFFFSLFTLFTLLTLFTQFSLSLIPTLLSSRFHLFSLSPFHFFRFKDLFKRLAKLGSDTIESYSTYGYDAVWVMAHAIHKLINKNGGDVDGITGKDLLQQLKKTTYKVDPLPSSSLPLFLSSSLPLFLSLLISNPLCISFFLSLFNLLRESLVRSNLIRTEILQILNIPSSIIVSK
jgi:hypothetical protein